MKASIELDNIPSRGFSKQRSAYSLVGAILIVFVIDLDKRG